MRELPDWRHPAPAARDKHPVLAVYDGTAASGHALACAAGVAGRAGHWLAVARVWRLAAFQAGRMRRLRAELAGISLGCLDVEIVSLARDPARELIRAAAEHRADALVIGAPRRLVPGPMAARVMRRVDCPVVVVP
jgi:nucleotide-binding universal stress UspA family protein